MKVFKYHDMVSLDMKEIEKLKYAHQAIFSDVLKINPSWLKCVFEQAEKNYLVVPLRVVETCGDHSSLSPVVYIDFVSVDLLIDLGPSLHCLKPIAWPIPVSTFRNTIVIPIHSGKRVLHEVNEVSESINLSSLFPTSDRKTYFKHFTDKYKYKFTDASQPALICSALGISPSYLQLLVSRFKSTSGESIKKSKKRGKQIELFPELCFFYPLPSDLWKLLRCLPSILWRIECLLIVDTFHSRINTETGIGLYGDGSELTTYINFRGYKDMGYGDLATQKYIPGRFDHDQQQQREPEMICLIDCNPWDPPVRSPDNALLLQALTTKGAGDSVNLERLETLGDSFLKFSTSTFLYFDRLAAHEGKLTKARANRVGNFNLYYLAKRLEIPRSILSVIFDPSRMWIPPCFFLYEEDQSLQEASSYQVDQLMSASEKDLTCKVPVLSEHEKSYLHHKLNDKAVADCMESLIGVYLVSGGILAALTVMEWMGIKIVRKQEQQEGALSTSEGEVVDVCLTPRKSWCMRSRDTFHHPSCAKRPKLAHSSSLFVRDSSTLLNNFFRLPLRCLSSGLEHQQQTELNRLLNIALGDHNIDDVIGWKFNDRKLLLQALTHASYTKNRLTNSYQRLEFLGDAVLDYLVTCHIYSTFPLYGPGEISCLRSALVNNITFAELAIDMNLNSFLLHNSPSLFKQIELYLKAVKKISQQGNVSKSVNKKKQVCMYVCMCVCIFLSLKTNNT